MDSAAYLSLLDPAQVRAHRRSRLVPLIGSAQGPGPPSTHIARQRGRVCSCRRIPSSRTEAVRSLPTPTRPVCVCDPAVVAADAAATHSATLPTTNLTTLLGGRPPIDRPPTQLHYHLRPPTRLRLRLVLAAGHLPSVPIHTRRPQSTSPLHHE